ncbi:MULTISPECIES: TDT family transporter [unclassified Acinetobacter]|uniref:TDT family transporter n=1 Tax=unclassified Acinetobacter TaxID=196816 RepID=UPI002934A5BE|nr:MULTISPECIES: TDT family transporter [unclassified Acinetobacter]WOE30817.1 TDT family transporter [Acinetobacter sp. SAAs470]WOE39012.1 TDT family transporter [Acinetobacter sp. SAAs474]
MHKPFYQLQQLHDIIRHFTPNWFTVIMGTGVVALILPQLPLTESLTWILGQCLWQLNIVLFCLFSILYLLRWIIYPQEAKQIFTHPVMSLFLGTIPMGLATILNGFLKFGVVLYGDIALDIASVLWYIDVILAVMIAWLIPFCMYHQQQHQLHTMTAVWLLPIVACEVAATSGGLLLAYLLPSQHSVMILLISYMLWGISVLPAFAILTILMLRLALHQLPSKELAMSSWLALGPIGTGALALLVLGQHAPQVLSSIDLQNLGVMAQNLGLLASLILVGFGLWWLGIAVLTTLKHARIALPFNLGWWGLTFPLGVFTLALFNLAQQMHLVWIHQMAYFFAIILIALWLLVATKTVKGFYQGNLFFSPCLKAYLERKKQSF